MLKTIKKIFIRDEQKQELEGLETWIVSWTARYGTFSSDTRPVAQFFTNKSDATDFAKALEDAFTLVQNSSSDSYVSVDKQ